MPLPSIWDNRKIWFKELPSALNWNENASYNPNQYWVAIRFRRTMVPFAPSVVRRGFWFSIDRIFSASAFIGAVPFGSQDDALSISVQSWTGISTKPDEQIDDRRGVVGLSASQSACDYSGTAGIRHSIVAGQP
jgi:hypothetical protein